MSSGMYRRRWVNAGNDGSSTSVQRNENVTQAIIPHTYGTRSVNLFKYLSHMSFRDKNEVTLKRTSSVGIQVIVV